MNESPNPMVSQESLQELCPMLEDRMSHLLIPQGRRPHLAVCCFAIAIDHQNGIAALLLVYDNWSRPSS